MVLKPWRPDHRFTVASSLQFSPFLVSFVFQSREIESNKPQNPQSEFLNPKIVKSFSIPRHHRAAVQLRTLAVFRIDVFLLSTLAMSLVTTGPLSLTGGQDNSTTSDEIPSTFVPSADSGSEITDDNSDFDSDGVEISECVVRALAQTLRSIFFLAEAMGTSFKMGLLKLLC